MSEHSAISWTDATFNPWWGCTKVSPACDHCYAERDAHRFAPARTLWGVGSERRTFGDKHWNEPLRWAKTLPAKLGRRPRVFCASMADVFDKDAPPDERTRLWRLIYETPQLDWLLLTKRIGNAHRMLPEAWVDSLIPRMPDNVWLGATVVNQEEADRDIPKLLELPARVRFLSIEPMLGPIDLSGIPVGGGHGHHEFDPIITGNALRRADFDAPRLHWIIAGGESGPSARPMHPDWARSLRDQCEEAGVPFHFKQWGEYVAGEPSRNPAYPTDTAAAWRRDQTGARWHDPREQWDSMQPVTFLRIGKARAGRALDGIEHNGFPA
jgi:protein gp37